MNGWRRRDLLALAAMPWQAMRGQAPPAPPPGTGNSRDPGAGFSSPPSAPVIAEAPEGAIARLNDGPLKGMRWRIRYYFDELEKTCRLQDFCMPVPEFGLASLIIEEDGGKTSSRLLRTRDNGDTWTLERTDKGVLGVFVLDALHAWVVSPGHLLATADSGKRWEKFDLPVKTVSQVYFASSNTGWAFGLGKVFYQTGNGGRSWTAVTQSIELNLVSPETYLRSMSMLSTGAGMLVGDSTAATPDMLEGYEWMAPERALRRRAVPGSGVLYTTTDLGKTWKGRLTSAFGHMRRVRMSSGRAAVVFQYADSFSWPSELYSIGMWSANSRTVLRRKDLIIHDTLLLGDNGMLVAATQTSGRLRTSPIPAKLRMLWSPDEQAWFEMQVDYRAQGREATFARCSDGGLWAATDDGAILKLS